MIPEWKKHNISIMNKNSLNQTYIQACEQGDLELIKFVLTSKELKKHADPYLLNDSCLSIACKNNYIEIVQYFLTTNELERIFNIHADNEKPLLTACSYGNNDIVQYLLTSKELKEHATLNKNNNKILIAVCKSENINLLDYLLTSSDLVSHLIIDKKIIPKLIKTTLDNHMWITTAYLINNHELFKEKINEINLKKYPVIKKQLEDNILKNKLDQQLNISNINGQKFKI